MSSEIIIGFLGLATIAGITAYYANKQQKEPQKQKKVKKILIELKGNKLDVYCESLRDTYKILSGNDYVLVCPIDFKLPRQFVPPLVIALPEGYKTKTSTKTGILIQVCCEIDAKIIIKDLTENSEGPNLVKYIYCKSPDYNLIKNLPQGVMV